VPAAEIQSDIHIVQVVDVQAIQELAAVYRVKPVIIKSMAHDCMLVSAGKGSESTGLEVYCNRHCNLACR